MDVITSERIHMQCWDLVYFSSGYPREKVLLQILRDSRFYREGIQFCKSLKNVLGIKDYFPSCGTSALKLF